MRRIKVKTLTGRHIIHYEKKRVGEPTCANCHKPLHGVARGRMNKMKDLAKTQKRPERPYGGQLCSSCMRNVIKARFVYKTG